MTIRDMKGTVMDEIPIQTALVSVFDKSGLELLLPELVRLNPDILFISTGGTYKKISELFMDAPVHPKLIDVGTYTGAPEMEGGLVKTLHPKIFAGILAERNNPEHRRYLREDMGGALYIDLVVVNLYPFTKVIADPSVTFEKARGNIDIGGPAMIRATAKNFPSVAVLCDHSDYKPFLSQVRMHHGKTTFNQRAALALTVFEQMRHYDGAIAAYWEQTLKQGFSSLKQGYTFGGK